MKGKFIRLIPMCVFLIGLMLVVLCEGKDKHVLIVIIVTSISGVLTNLYLVNRNIKHKVIWINPWIDRLFGCICGAIYLSIIPIIILQNYEHIWIVYFIFACAVLMILFLESKLKIDVYNRNNPNHEYKVISEKLERQLKILAIIVTIISIIAMITALYLKWWIVFGVAVGLLLLVAIGLIIYDKYFTTKL